MAAIPGTPIANGSPLVRADSNDDGYLLDADDVRGGHRSVATITLRDAIRAKCRVEGMTAAVAETGLTYKLVGGITNDSWQNVLANVVDAGLVSAESESVLERHLAPQVVSLGKLAAEVRSLFGAGGLDPDLGLAWDASTDTPTVPTAAGNTGRWYYVSVAGTATGNAAGTYDVADRLLSDGTSWQVLKAPPTNIPDGTLSLAALGDIEIRDDAVLDNEDEDAIAICFATEDGTESIVTWTPLNKQIPDPAAAVAGQVAGLNARVDEVETATAALAPAGIPLGWLEHFEVREDGAYIDDGDDRVHLPVVYATEDGTEVVSGSDTDGTVFPRQGEGLVGLAARVDEVEAATSALAPDSLPLAWLEGYEIREEGAWIEDEGAESGKVHLPIVYATEDGTEIVSGSSTDGVVYPRQTGGSGEDGWTPPDDRVFFGMEEGGLGVSDADGERAIIDDGALWRDVHPTKDDHLLLARSDRFGLPAGYRVNILIPSALPLCTTTLYHFGANGQSLAGGASSHPILSAVAVHPEYNLMFNGGMFAAGGSGGLDPADMVELVPMEERADGANRESPWPGCFNTLNTLNRQRMNMRVRFLLSNHSRGGTPYSGIKKGTSIYGYGLYEIERGMALAAARGWKYVYLGSTMVHGENDRLIGTTAEAYEGFMKEYDSDMVADVMALTGQTWEPRLFLDQCHSWSAPAYGFETPTSTLGQLRAAETAARITLVTPKYMLTHSGDGIHLPGQSSRRLGEYYAKALAAVLWGSGHWHPFAPVEIGQTSDTVWARMRTPAGHSMVLDTSLVTNPDRYVGDVLVPGRYGFELVGAEITADPFLDGDRIVVPKTGTATDLRYAYTMTAGARGGPTSGPRGCLRDTDPTVSVYDSTLLHNYAATFSKAVPSAS